MSEPIINIKPLRILLVEDNADNVLVIQVYLKQFPFELDVAANGEIGVEKFRNGAYDLVLMDIQMPVMDGYSASRAIRAMEAEKGMDRTPIIAITANASTENRRRVLEAGGDDFVTKPVPKKSLLEAIQRVVS